MGVRQTVRTPATLAEVLRADQKKRSPMQLVPAPGRHSPRFPDRFLEPIQKPSPLDDVPAHGRHSSRFLNSSFMGLSSEWDRVSRAALMSRRHWSFRGRVSIILRWAGLPMAAVILRIELFCRSS